MKQLPYFLVIIGLCFGLSGCAPQKGVIPTPQEVAARRKTPTLEEAYVFCQEKGGQLEDWKNNDGSKTTYCVFKQDGYGCDPMLFATGMCGKGY